MTSRTKFYAINLAFQSLLLGMQLRGLIAELAWPQLMFVATHCAFVVLAWIWLSRAVPELSSLKAKEAS